MTSHAACAPPRVPLPGGRPAPGAGAGPTATGTRVVLRSRRVVLPEGERPATVHVEGGRIVAIGDPGEAPAGARLVDVGDAALLPALVDPHVHVNAPGRAEWEGFETATRAAAAGGVGVLLDMPLNSLPPVTDAAALEAKRRAAHGVARVDVGFWAGAVPGNEGERAALHGAGAFGFKAFLCDSGVAEFPPLDAAALERLLAQAAGLGARVLVHAEWPPALVPAAAGADPRRYATWQATRPRAAEDDAVELVLALARRTGARVHVVHVASAGAVRLIEVARALGLPVTAETCPHYLTFAAEDVPDGAPLFKCAPPIREAAEREALWDALARGVLDAVVTDHSPSDPAGRRLASGDVLGAWGGIASLGLALPVVWTEAQRRGFTLADVTRWLSTGPARIAGLAASHGALAPGRDADLVLFDPDAEWTVDADALHFRHRLTPYAGRRLRGVVRATWLRGAPVYADGRFPDPPRGRLLERP